MPLRLTSATVAGVKKHKSAASRKTQPSPFAAHARGKPGSAAANGVKRAAEEGLLLFDEDLPDLGPSHHISDTAQVENVIQAVEYIRSKMFDELPPRAGINSTRIAEVLNLRRSLPPLASVAHVHMLMNAPTQVEREIVEQVRAGRIRRLIVPGRGNDAAGLGDCLVLAEDWDKMVRESSALDAALKEKFLGIVSRMGTTSSSAISQNMFETEEYRALMRAGFLVSSSTFTQGSLSLASLPKVPNAAVTSASRSEPGRASDTDRSVQTNAQSRAATLFLSLPNTGTYLRLLETGRTHLLSLLKRSSCSEVPMGLLKDRWDGAVETEKSFHLAKRARGEFAGILPGKTKKWKDLKGMRFRWVLEEALGAGLAEIFETGSPHPFTALPAHPSLPPGPTRPEARQVASIALQEALELLNTDLPTWDRESKPRRSPPARADVHLSRKWRKNEEPNAPGKPKPEFWVCRQSEHSDSSTPGSASWSEFEDGLRSDHAEHEMEYTPSVTSVERLLQWTEQEIGELDLNGFIFKDVDVEVNLITHKFHPTALISPRSFISFTISATYDAHKNEPDIPAKGFVTVQIPLSADPSTTPTPIHEKIMSAVPKRTVFAHYASVERVGKRNSSAEHTASQQTKTATGSNDSIQWIMATTSDAGGSIPQWIQRNWTLGGVPKAVVADVGLFMDWTEKRRGSN
ncbi:Serine-threonine protein kinase 19 [Penicillium argentinense]|uniref:Serine-threonine protein kinase 19 n=1 Tax=Penicillium argentinense TaxID=1131581 RepID=A0A9W9EHU8_9EURO|nr:Serine-threonine protein kinase 19 [Penicillium argentinense]KAJ5082068.1 Serine-threonine protein kinase 19 [Penicillium argentinense]